MRHSGTFKKCVRTNKSVISQSLRFSRSHHRRGTHAILQKVLKCGEQRIRGQVQGPRTSKVRVSLLNIGKQTLATEFFGGRWYVLQRVRERSMMDGDTMFAGHFLPTL